MKLPQEGLLLRIFVGETDLLEGRPLYERIVEEARLLNLAGATVLRGMMGYGAGSRIHTAKFVRVKEDLPVVIELVDSEAQIEKLLPFLDKVVAEGLVTLERVRVIKYRNREA